MFSKQRLSMLAVGVALALTANLFAQEPVDRTPVAKSADVGRVPKVCVLEPTPKKITVYSSTTREYCIKHSFRPFHGIFELCGLCSDEGSCAGCELHTKEVLVIKKIDGPCVQKCVLKDAPPCTIYEQIVPPAKK